MCFEETDIMLAARFLKDYAGLKKMPLDWYLLEDESHTELKDFTKKCLKLNGAIYLRCGWHE